MSFHFFPLLEILRDPAGNPLCSCRKGAKCVAIGKHPKIFGWQKPEFEEDGKVGPSGGYGIPTGKLNQIVVVDLDVKPDKGIDGVDSLTKLGPIPPTTIVQTPSGGAHIYFQYPAGLELRDSHSVLGPGIDIRAEGGFVVGPGSPHKRGGVYQVIQDLPLAPLPAWLLERLRLIEEGRKRPPRSEQDGLTGRPKLPEKTGAALDQAVDWAKKYLEKAPPCIEDGTSSSKLMKYCTAIRAKGIPLTQCLELLEEIFNPRCIPPWSSDDLVRALCNVEDGYVIESIAADLQSFENFTKQVQAASASYANGAPVNPPIVMGTPSYPAPKPQKPPPNPNHVYAFRPGDRSGAEGAMKIRFDRLVAELFESRHWDGVLWHDEFSDWIYAVNPPLKLDAEGDEGLSKRDIARVQAWFNANGMSPTIESVENAIELAASRRGYHPVKDYLFGLPPATPYDHALLDDFAAKVFGNDEPLARDMFKKTLVSAVRRILVPGTQVDTMLVLKGDEGLKKSRIWRALFGSQFYKDQLPDLRDDAKASHSLRGFWCVESGELDKFLRADNPTAKAFLSRDEDCYHAPYGHRDVRKKRQCIIVGTTNADDFLTDATGNRRYWIIVVYKEIDVSYVSSIRDSLWAAALELAKDARYEHWFNDAAGEAEASRTPHEYRDPWHAVIEDYCAGREKATWEEVYSKGVARNIPDALAKASRREMSRVCAVLKRLGCKQKNARENGVRWYGWMMPDTLRFRIPSAEEQSRRKAEASLEAMKAMSERRGSN